jgi:serine phosphatase RsbU (regulator of sigma subunit)
MDDRLHPNATFPAGTEGGSPASGGAGITPRAGQLRVLLIEDDDGDALLVQELLAEAGAGKQRLLGGDFYDMVEAADGWVHALVGDVCGHGAGEAALGVCLRVAWRALVLAGRPAEEVLATVQQVLEHEQQEEAMFATVCMVSVAPDRRSGILRLAGHPAPLLVTRDGVTELTAPVSPPLGLNAARRWPGFEVALGDNWSLLLYTDGLIEGRISQGPYRLDTEGLIDLVRDALGPLPFDPGRVSEEHLLRRLTEQVRKLNNGDLNDDIAILALGYS